MRTNIKFIIVIVTFFGFFSSSSWAGTEVSGGGGNAFVSEFRSIAVNVLERLDEREARVGVGRSLSVSRMREKFTSTTVASSRKALFLKGQPVSAINYPQANEIIFNQDDWSLLNYEGKVQLVLHELIGLTFAGAVDDSHYELSRKLGFLVTLTGIENVALSMARANIWEGLAKKMRVQSERTKVIQDYSEESPEQEKIVEIYVQTFENGSNESVRIYRLFIDGAGIVWKCEMVGTEGAVGP